MNFQQAINSGFRNYATFAGRAARSEYWFWALFSFIGNVVTMILDVSIFGTSVSSNELAPLNVIFAIITLLPSLAMGARRLHDINRSGWWLLIAIVPLVGFILLIVWACTKGTDGDNRFGADPLG